MIALDTSVAVPLLVAAHPLHKTVVRWRAERLVALSGHALIETYAVLTRWPGGIRLLPVDAVRLLDRINRLLLPENVVGNVPTLLAKAGVAGGATYDGLVALTALHHGVPLATRDLRARDTYLRLDVEIETVA